MLAVAERTLKLDPNEARGYNGWFTAERVHITNLLDSSDYPRIELDISDIQQEHTPQIMIDLSRNSSAKLGLELVRLAVGHINGADGFLRGLDSIVEQLP